MRPLGIPTLIDRIIQEIFRMALEPIAEYHFHDNSYGFRPKRSCHDAIDSLRKYLAQSNRKTYIVEGDIKGCFDHISHDCITETLGMWKIPAYAINCIRKMLKAKILDNFTLHDSTEGTPQGGVISPMLANVALTGLDNHITERFGALTYQGGKQRISPMIRYADDFVIVCRSKFNARMIKEVTGEYLKGIGLTLSEEKTHITHIKKGFDFLGFTLKKHVKLGIKNPKGMRDYKLLITPSREKVINILRNCKEVLDKHKTITQDALIRLLNSKLRGWGNYYRFVNSSIIFNKIDYAMWNKTKRWCIRRHSNKNVKWIFNNLFKQRRKSLYFETDDTQLIRLTTFSIVNHPKVAKGKRVYCKEHADYWEKREYRLMFNRLFSIHKTLYKKQKGNCSQCNYPFALHDDLHIHHIIPKADGGTDEQSNLSLLHADCHHDLHKSYGLK
jgi:RNA-directed DNA polymerase